MILEEKNIFLDEDLSSKEEVIEFIADEAKYLGITDDRDGLLKDLFKREEEYSTGIQDGFAIPHAKSEYVKTPTILYIKTNKEIEWETLDDSKVRYIFNLLVPKENEDNVHLKMLSKLATCLMEDDFKKEVIEAVDKSELIKYISKKMREE